MVLAPKFGLWMVARAGAHVHLYNVVLRLHAATSAAHAVWQTSSSFVAAGWAGEERLTDLKLPLPRMGTEGTEGKRRKARRK